MVHGWVFSIWVYVFVLQNLKALTLGYKFNALRNIAYIM